MSQTEKDYEAVELVAKAKRLDEVIARCEHILTNIGYTIQHGEIAESIRNIAKGETK